ncbi:swt1 RNA endoribonuclease isoform X2 [Rhipicephalus microplus]|uniref:swt1 RNA endoribonuclease isoform X2 n=1 Tax=Rhipicephalus microplus TaxID=6941 RepID=UPI003F6A74BE
MVNCAVFGCYNHSKKKPGDENASDVGFFSIPKVIVNQCKRTKDVTQRRRAEWLRRINRKDLDGSATHYRVCGKHFISGRPSYAMAEADPDWAPSLHLGYGNPRDSGSSASRHTRHLKRLQKKHKPFQPLQACSDDDSIPPTPLDCGDNSEEPEMAIQEECSISGRTDFGQTTELTMLQIKLLEEENNRLISELVDTKGQLRTRILSEECLKEKPDMLQFYTGMPNFNLLWALFLVLERGISHTSLNCLTKFQEMLVFLICLRLNVPLQDLAYRFHVSRATISRVFNKWLDAAFVRLERAVVWPERDVLRKTMPMVFRKAFGTDVVVILDCFEVFIERPSSMISRSQTWSTYKNHNTVKFLVGIAPQGNVTFMSRGWCGRTSDKAITEGSKVLDNLLPGDMVLADRGFTISDSVGIRSARLVTPAFTKGKPQLSAFQVERTRRVANVRIHVERVIGLLRNKFRILKHTLPVEMLTADENGATVLDKTFVCAALVNLCDFLVPFG